MSHPVETASETHQKLKRLLEAVRIPVIIAERSLRSVLALIGINLASALWLTYFVSHAFSLSFALLGLIFVPASLPTLFFIKIYFALQEVIVLPKKIVNFFQTSENKLAEYQQFQQKLRTQIQDKNIQLDDLHSARQHVTGLFTLGSRIRDWFALGGRLKDLKTLLNESVELRNAAVSAMLFASPFFIATTILALVISTACTLTALITLLIHFL